MPTLLTSEGEYKAGVPGVPQATVDDVIRTSNMTIEMKSNFRYISSYCY